MRRREFPGLEISRAQREVKKKKKFCTVIPLLSPPKSKPLIGTEINKAQEL